MALSPPRSPYRDDDIPTRTVAIIKHHALEHRLAIERRIEEAGFEIIKERQMEFDDSSDEEFLQELFGEDAASLFEGPVWVYVLGRRRAVPVFKTLMGDADPAVAKDLAPTSIRAMYGISIDQNAVMGAPDHQTAEEQIACLFASSPPFPPTFGGDEFEDVEDEIALDDRHHDEYEQEERVSRHRASTDGDDWKENKSFSPSSSRTAASSTSGSALPSFIPNSSPTHTLTVPALGSASPNSKRVPFRARPVPVTNVAPSIRPRTSRAAELRVALKQANSPDSPKKPKSSKFVPPVYNKARDCPTRDEVKQVFMDVPGHKRSEVIKVASTAPPTIAPRMTRAVSLRLGGAATPKASPVKKSLSTGSTKSQKADENVQEPPKNVFEGVPGHKRAETIPVASVKPPVVAPRQNKAAALRVQKDSAPPSSFMFKPPTERVLPARSSSRLSMQDGGVSRPSTSQGHYSSSATAPEPAPVDIPHSHNRRPSISQGSDSPSRHGRAPSIAPRSNRSAMLRQRSGSISTAPVSPFAGKMGKAVLA